MSNVRLLRATMELDATHKVSMAAIQRLSIECHALDTSPLSLGFASTHRDNPQTRLAFRELFTERLLQLAISLRVKFYQGADPALTTTYLMHTGFLEVTRKGQPFSVEITFKDVCDKIIHAEEMIREYDVGHKEQGVLTVLRGTEQSGSPWTMGLSVSLFCEAVLSWLHDQAAT
jgi:hypothetical protein